MAALVRARVQGGVYANEREVIHDELRSLLARDRTIEPWLQTQVASAFDAIAQHSNSVCSVGQVRANARGAKEACVSAIALNSHVLPKIAGCVRSTC